MSSKTIEDNLKSYSIPISLIRQHLFCPRIPYFSLISDYHPAMKPWMVSGIYAHKKAIMKFERRVLSRFGLTDSAEWRTGVFANDDQLGIHGILDAALVDGGKYYPVEWKQNKGRPPYAHLLQITAYSMCLERMGVLVEKGFICSIENTKIYPVSWNGEYKEDVRLYISEIRSNLDRPIFPETPASKDKCIQCEYVLQCNDRVLE